MENRTGFAATVSGLFLQTALVAALFKVQVIAGAIPADGGVKKFRSIGSIVSCLLYTVLNEIIIFDIINPRGFICV